MTDAPVLCPGCGCNLQAERPVQLGPLHFDPSGAALWADGPVRLTPQQHLLLGSLVAANGLVPRHILAERVGNDTDGNVIEVLMSKLRRALRGAGAPAALIETWPRRGYRLNRALLGDDEAQSR